MRNRLLVFPLAAVVLLFSDSPSTYAHHATASFDMTNSISVKGTVTGFDWTNPHAYIYIEVKDSGGALEKWSVEMGSTGMLARAGWKRDTLKAGEEITAIGNRARDGRPLLHLNKVVFANGQELTQNVR